ncbi:MAG: exodeoxyribonuclease VII small subunit [Burkholderiales bacterium]
MSKSPRQSSAAEAQAVSQLTFEKALAELERVVARMEGGNLSLEQALDAHKRGLELARYCQERLEAAQQQVKVLEDGVLKPLAAAESESGDRD